MTNDEAKAIVAQIDGLHASEANQINVEFEGEHPGFDMPQHAKRVDLIDLINQSGTHAYAHAYGLRERVEFTAIREKWNALVRAWMAKNPGKSLHVTQMQKWEKEVGMTQSEIKHFASEFDASKTK